MSEEPVLRIRFTSAIGEKMELSRVGDMLILRGEESSKPLRMGPETILGTALLAVKERETAALEWAAGQVGAAGCLCDHLVGRVAAAAAKRGERPHDDCCPAALAAKIRGGAP